MTTSCFCTSGAPLCWACLDRLVYARWRAAQQVAREWAKRMHRLKPGLTWPGWDEDSDRAARMRDRARELVRDLHDHPEVRERLARCCGVTAGREYADTSWPPERRVRGPAVRKR